MSKSVLTAGRPSVARGSAVTLSSLSDGAATKRVNFMLPADEHMQLKIYAAKQGKTITELLSDYVAKLIKGGATEAG